MFEYEINFMREKVMKNSDHKILESYPNFIVYGDEDTEETKLLGQVLALENLTPELKESLEKLLPKFKGKLVPQEQVNDLLTKERKKAKDEVSKIVNDLEQYKKTAQMTAQQKDELQKQIEALQNSVMTETEKTQREQERLRNEHKSALENKDKETTMWKHLFSSESIKNGILAAASKHDAARHEQMIDLLMPKTQVVEERDANGNVVPGRYVPRVKFSDVDDKGQPVELELSIDETVKRMKDLPDRFGNLFKGQGSGGLGENKGNNGSGSLSDPNNPPKDREQYLKWRERHIKPKQTA